MLQSFLLLLPLFAGALPTAAAARDEVAASARGATLSWAELDRLLLDRYAGSEDGRDALDHLVRSELLVRLEREFGLGVTDEDVERRLREVDRQLRATSPDGRGIAAQLEETGLSEEEFRRYLRLAIVQEQLTRRALGKDDDDPLTGEEQTMWLDQVMAERGCGELPVPWAAPGAGPETVVARCADVQVTLGEYLPHLRRALPPEDLRRACYQLLLDRLMTARLPDLGQEALDAAVAAEIERRRREAESDPKNQGVGYAALLQAQGIQPSSLPRDPVVRVTALSRLFVDRKYDEEALRGVYANERDFFDGTFGEAVDLSILYLRAARFPNELIPRSFDEAEAELEALRPRIRTGQEFQRLAARTSEAPGARQDKGAVGFVTRLDPRLDETVRAAVFEALAARTSADPPASERLVGPLRVATGAVLLWLGERRPAPPWERMAVHVRTELRRRFIEDEVLPESNVVTWMDLESK